MESGDLVPIQILSLGAGFDTTYFWIKDLIASGVFPATLGEQLRYFEADFHDVVEKKIQFIQKNEVLLKHIWTDTLEGEVQPH